MLSQSYYGVISPEGAASILGRYKDDAHKAQQYPKDCHELATAQRIYAYWTAGVSSARGKIIWDFSETMDEVGSSGPPIWKSTLKSKFI